MSGGRWGAPRPGGRRFAAGALCGALAVFGVRACVNQTSVADWMIAPLLLGDDAAPADAIVVLGASVVGECAPSHNAVRRVMIAARQWRDKRAPVVLISGGSGMASCPVAVAMARFARDIGLPESAIRVEAASRNTHENAQFSGALLQGWGMRRLLLVTDRLHVRRAAGAFRGLGFDVGHVAVPIFEGHDDNVAMLTAGIREYAALGYYRLRGWVGSAKAARDASPTGRLAIRHARNAEGPIVLLGASYALGWDLRSVAGVSIVNRGVTGQQSFELLQRFDRDVIAAAPRAVILWGFINDIFRAPPGGIEPALARIRESYTGLIAMARQHGIEPILATEVTVRPPSGSIVEAVVNRIGALTGRPSYQDAVNRHVAETNHWLTELARREGVLVLDLQSVVAEPGGRRRPVFAQPDGSHLTQAAYGLLTSYASPILEEFLGVE